MTGTALETLADDRQYMDRLPALAREFASSSMCPETWRLKPVPANASKGAAELVAQENDRKVADLAIIGQSLAELDLRLGLNVLPQVYVVHGRPGFMAQLQIALAARFNCHIVPLDDESGAKKGVVKVLGKDRQWHRVTVTMEEAETAGWPKKNPNYASMPDRMLMARAVTKAIGLHCPEAKLMLPPADQAEMDFDADPTTGEIAPPALDRQVPPRSIAPDGTTIPEHLREPAIDEDARDSLIAQLETLSPPVLAAVQERARELAIPNLKSARVTRAHGVLVAMLIEHAQITADRERGVEPEVVQSGDVPADVIDGQPEASNLFGDDGAPF